MSDVTIRLYGPIGGFFGYTPEEIMDQIPADTKRVTLRINSPGGAVGDGIALYRLLRDHPAHVTTIVDGMAASMASVIMLAGDERLVHSASMGVVHNPWMYAEGNSADLRKTADVLDKWGEAILTIYTERTGLSETELRALMDADTYMTGADLMAKGFADRMIGDESANNAIAAMLRDFSHVAAKVKGADMAAKKPNHSIEEALRLKTIEAEETAAKLTEAEAKITELVGTKPDAVADLESDVVKAAIAEARAGAEAAVQSKIDEAQALVIKTAKERDEARDELTATNAVVESQKADLATARGMLANPALVNDAALKALGLDDLPEGGKTDAEIEAEEAARIAAEQNETSETPHWDAFNKMSGRDRTRYWAEHQNELNAEQKALAAKEKDNA